MPDDITLIDILRNQIELVKNSMKNHEKMYNACCCSVKDMSRGYKPVTVQDTREVTCQFILSPFTSVNV